MKAESENRMGVICAVSPGFGICIGLTSDKPVHGRKQRLPSNGGTKTVLLLRTTHERP